MTKNTAFGGTVVEHLTHNPKIYGSNIHYWFWHKENGNLLKYKGQFTRKREIA
jgi:hypothetical protein